jgi:hypothetical protein
MRIINAEPEGAAVMESPKPSSFVRFRATDVTFTREVPEAEFQASTPTWAVTRALAAQMSLPLGVPYALRDDRTSAYLDDEKPIGDHIRSDENPTVSVTPRTHLG